MSWLFFRERINKWIFFSICLNSFVQTGYWLFLIYLFIYKRHTNTYKDTIVVYNIYLSNGSTCNDPFFPNILRFLFLSFLYRSLFIYFFFFFCLILIGLFSLSLCLYCVYIILHFPPKNFVASEMISRDTFYISHWPKVYTHGLLFSILFYFHYP